MKVPAGTLAFLVLLASSVAVAADRPRLNAELVASGPPVDFSSSWDYAPLGNSLIFRSGPAGDRDLYRFDGTTVVPISNPYSSLDPEFRVWNVLNNDLYFSAGSSIGSALYRTDGSSIQLVADLNSSTANDQSIKELYTLGNDVIAFATGNNGYEVFSTNGTTTSEYDLLSGPGSSSPRFLKLFGNEMLFSAKDDLGGSNRALYRTTGGAPERLGEYGLNNLPFSGSILESNGDLYWADGDTMYRYDSNSVSTALTIDGVTNLRLHYASDGIFGFNGNGSTGSAIYTWDGNTVREFDTDGPGNAFHSIVLELPSGDEMYFLVDALSTTSFYRSDGTQAVEILGSPGNTHLNPVPDEIAVLNDQLIFRSDGPVGNELYRLGNGNVAELIADINPSGDAFFLSEYKPVEFQGELYFRAMSPTTGVELYKTDGTSVTAFDRLPGPNNGGAESLTIEDGLPLLWYVSEFGGGQPNLFLTNGETVGSFETYIPEIAGDPSIGSVDIVEVAGDVYFFAPSGNIYRLAVVPEPASASLLLVGIVALIMGRRRKPEMKRTGRVAQCVCS